VGASTDSSSVAYLRPETAQGIFTNFKNVQQSARTKVPFGIAQVRTTSVLAAITTDTIELCFEFSHSVSNCINLSAVTCA
jgi:hypothetical protein